jgi:uncharacterized membrane protein YedE/YeeE
VRPAVVSYVAGVVFGLGLGIAGMTRPVKVVGFLDFFGAWDPSLAFVMAGAIAVHATAYWLARRRSSPLLAKAVLPTRRDVDAPLVAGAVLFGVGWGLSGFCPGPALTSLATLRAPVVIFVAAMLGGMAVQGLVARRAARTEHESAVPPGLALSEDA